MDAYNPFSLKDKTILVTGASSGIGQATAIECSRLGARLVVTGRDAERLQATFSRLDGNGHRQLLADLESESDVERLVAECPALNGVALCAGVGSVLPLRLCSFDRISEVLNANFAAPVNFLRLLTKERKIAAGGSVVLVSSVAGSRGGVAAGNTLYGASKAALDAAMRHLAREFGSRIRFNTVNPGTVNTPLAQRLRRMMTDEQVAAELASYPLGRLGEPNDVAHGIVYLLSDAAAWVTGTQLVIDGGLTI